MKKMITQGLLSVALIIAGNNAFSQVDPGSPEYQTMKESGQIEQPEQVDAPAPAKAILPEESGARDFGLFVPLDNTFSVAMAPNDDGSSSVFTLPFNFCFYGDTYTTFHINNNGNVTFDGPFGGFTSTGFPVVGRKMLAPFWADVDTRSNLGTVYYKIESTRVIVIWNNVGYFSIQGDKRNTFQLIFTNGNDPLIGIGNNVAFSFGDMQWTTGSASGGSGGFGGTPATVGVNKGDGVKYALVGRFNQPGTAFDGAGGNPDGVSYLDGKYYTFNACEEDVVIPGEVPVSDWALYIGIILILGFAIFRFRRMA